MAIASPSPAALSVFIRIIKPYSGRRYSRDASTDVDRQDNEFGFHDHSQEKH